MTSRRPIGLRRRGGVLAQSTPCLLLVAWESYMTPSCTVTTVYKAARIRVKGIFVITLLSDWESVVQASKVLGLTQVHCITVFRTKLIMS
jgi:hypothetical protein